MTAKLALDRRDTAACIGLVLVALAYAAAFFDFTRFPSEDAAMLMRYAKHVAEGNGIVWNIGEPPVDGATDFLFMLAVAGVARLGLSVEHAVHALCYLAHLATVVLVYAGARRHFRAPRWAALASAGFLAVGPGTLYTEAYFGTTFFALFLCLAWLAALGTMESGGGLRPALVFAVVALMAGLVRPEGVLVSVMMLAAIVLRLGLRRSRKVIALFALVFFVAGGAYLAWRVNHFGYLFPNPFYVKNGGNLHRESLVIATRNVWSLAFPFVVILAGGAVVLLASAAREEMRARRLVRGLGAAVILLFGAGLLRASNAAVHQQMWLGRYSPKYAGILACLLVAGLAGVASAPAIAKALSRATRTLLAALGVSAAGEAYVDRSAREMLVVLVPVVGFTCMWILIADQMNYLMRFQYPVLPVILMSWSATLPRRDGIELPDALSPRARRLAAAGAAAFVLLVAIAAAHQHRHLAASKHHRDSRYDVAMMLREYGANHYTIATTEAGLLPLYSEWRAVDLFGLNDLWIAHHGTFTDEYLDERHPEVIVIAAPYPIESTPSIGGVADRGDLVRLARQYAEDHGFTLAAAYGGDTSKAHYYYVRDDFAYAPELVRRIREMTYTWYRDGRVSVDYAAAPR